MKRREFVKNIGGGSLGLIAEPAILSVMASAEISAIHNWHFSSSSMASELSSTALGLVSLNIDSLGLGKGGANAI